MWNDPNKCWNLFCSNKQFFLEKRIIQLKALIELRPSILGHHIKLARKQSSFPGHRSCMSRSTWMKLTPVLCCGEGAYGNTPAACMTGPFHCIFPNKQAADIPQPSSGVSVLPLLAVEACKGEPCLPFTVLVLRQKCVLAGNVSVCLPLSSAFSSQRWKQNPAHGFAGWFFHRASGFT